MKRNVMTLLVLLVMQSVHAEKPKDFNSASPLLINAYHRQSTSLSGEWQIIVDPYENGYYDYRYQAFDQSDSPSRNAFFVNAKPLDKSELIEYNFDDSGTLLVPGDWNTQKPELFYYEGTIWYKKSFDYQKKETSNRVFVYFGAVNYESHIYLNGKKLGTHLGGFTPFNFDITDLLQEKDNFLVVKVDNKRKAEAVPTLNTDWWNYGGITRDVSLIEMPDTYISDYLLQLSPTDGSAIEGYIMLGGGDVANNEIELSIPDLNIKKTLSSDASGKVRISFKPKKLKYWSTEKPVLYDVQITSGQDIVTDKIGFRTIETKGHDILLNGKSIFLKGISIHGENPTDGRRAHSLDDAKQLLNWAKELGCNMVRLAHYPHSEHMVRLADEMGLLVWEENPVYWTIQWTNVDTYANAENQLREVICRDKNRASVIIWSMANETPTSPERLKFLTKLAEQTKEWDGTRLISAALERTSKEEDPHTMHIEDPFADYVDILSFNQYLGWYYLTPDDCKDVKWDIAQDKPVFISEFGGGAKFGLHGDKEQRWTEEYQEWLYQQTLDMLGKIPQLRGMSPWILVDFRSPRRPLPNVQDGWNRKGLLSEQGEKKKAYYVLQDYYSIK